MSQFWQYWGALRDFGGFEAGLVAQPVFWWGIKKLPKPLLELVGDPADVCHVVIGIGVNVNMIVASGVDQAWTSVRLETGCTINPVADYCS